MKKERKQNRKQAHASEQAAFRPSRWDGCILNGPLRHKQVACSLIVDPPGLKPPGRLRALQTYTYLHSAPRGDLIKNKRRKRKDLSSIFSDFFFLFSWSVFIVVSNNAVMPVLD